jgi:sulfite exporter TauE/SafE
MKDQRPNRLLDYFPCLAYLGFWFQGALLGSIVTGEPKLMALGIVTLPALLALALAARKIRKGHSQA